MKPRSAVEKVLPPFALDERALTTVATSATAELRRIPELDGLRGIAAVSVMNFHYFVNEFGSQSVIVRWGWSGVDLFFTLSGFLIATLLLHYQSSPNLPSVFWARRLSRIVPLFYVSVFLYWVSFTFILKSSDSNLPPLWTYLLFVNDLGGYLANDFGIIAVAWSLAIEEKFYLLAPLLFRYVNFRWRVVLLALGAAASVYYQWVMLQGSNEPRLYLRWEAICLGMLTAMFLHRQRPGFLRRPQTRAAAVLFLLALGISASLPDAVWSHRPTMYLRLALFCNALLVLILSFEGSGWTSWLRSKAMVWLGTVSYGIYLLHVLIGQFVSGAAHRAGVHNVILIGMFSMAATLLASHISWKYFESRFVERTRRRFTYRPTSEFDSH